MTDDAIFLAVEGSLTALRRADYGSEDVLQRVLAQFPELIAGVGTAGESARLLLVRREMPVAAADSVGLSLDHLFLDSSGVPILVEVKRASDTRSRREVVAQMLDYAANGMVSWENALRDAVAPGRGRSGSGHLPSGAARCGRRRGVLDRGRGQPAGGPHPAGLPR